MFMKIFYFFLKKKYIKKSNIFNYIIDKINKLENKFKKYSDNRLKNNTKFFYKLLKLGKNINDFLPEAFATVREASKRVLGFRHFDVQLLGGIILNNGCIAEMKTGEGKTLTSILTAYLNSLLGKGVHIVTINDYLAKRDAEFSYKLFKFLGLKVGLNLSYMSNYDKKLAYLADITYGTNNEYVFDYLRDNMVFSFKEKVQRKLYFAILDEIDSILIDESMIPLIISGSTENISDIYIKINNIVCCLIPIYCDDFYNLKNKGDFVIDYKNRNIFLTEKGILKIENLLFDNGFLNKGKKSLYEYKNIYLVHLIISSIKAHYLFLRNIHYLVKKNEIIIIDDNTGRVMPDRRWSDGLHQSIEAKENVEIKSDSQTLASITFQNYFRLYNKLCGMTGTALTEAFEFNYVYNLDVISIPTNKKMIRNDLSDLIFLTEKDKFNHIIKDILFRIKKNQPVLVGTNSVEKSEFISNLLKNLNIKHNVLNAKNHKLEAEIIAQAGKPGAVTIATNMAGRGTDIVLGGNWRSKFFFPDDNYKYDINYAKKIWKKDNKLVINSGGLHVIGTERNESRRIDNQLRGRSGRQGDPGSSIFYVSLEDSFMKIFIPKSIIIFMKNIGIDSSMFMENSLLSLAIENAQIRLENKNFNIRKNLLEYDDILNEQRKIFYLKRNKIIYLKKINIYFFSLIKKVIIFIFKKFLFNKDFYKKKKIKFIFNYFFKKFKIKEIDINLKNFSIFEIKKNIYKNMIYIYKKKEFFFGKKLLNKLGKNIILSILDLFWIEYLYEVDYLKNVIFLRGYSYNDPKQEYKKESFKIFTKMINRFNYEVVKVIINIPNKKFILEDTYNYYKLKNRNFYIF